MIKCLLGNPCGGAPDLGCERAANTTFILSLGGDASLCKEKTVRELTVLSTPLCAGRNIFLGSFWTASVFDKVNCLGNESGLVRLVAPDEVSKEPNSAQKGNDQWGK